jgi:hypothetical protein
MSALTFFAVSGGIAWTYLVWRLIGFLHWAFTSAGRVRRRMMWAVSGKPAKHHGVFRTTAR